MFRNKKSNELCQSSKVIILSNETSLVDSFEIETILSLRKKEIVTEKRKSSRQDLPLMMLLLLLLLV